MSIANDIILTVIAAVERAGTPYMLGKRFSGNIYGVFGSTWDADLILQTGDHSISDVVRSLGSDFELGPKLLAGTWRHTLTHVGSMFQITLFELSPDPHDQRRFSRRKQAGLAGHTIFVPTAEDVIITKLRWSKGGNGRKDVEDVENVIAVQGDALDLPYIRQWCDQHGTRELFEQVKSRAEA